MLPFPATPHDRPMVSETSCSIARSQKDEEGSRSDVQIHGFEPSETQERPDVRKIKRAFARNLPRTYRMTSKAILYLRGPRPKRDLDGAFCLVTPISFQLNGSPLNSAPAPFLSLTCHFNRRTWSLPLEPAWIRFTRSFTHPLLFVLFVVGYIVGLAFFARAQWYQTPPDTLYGCTATYWLANSQCGLDGRECLPTEYGQYDFRCPAGCDVILQNPRTVGNQEQEYVPLIVGGGDSNGTYRGDSFVCSAAVQACVSRIMHCEW